MDRKSPLRDIKGVGAKTEEIFHKIGVYTVGDILLHYPRTYIQYPQAKHVDEVSDGEQAASGFLSSDQELQKADPPAAHRLRSVC